MKRFMVLLLSCMLIVMCLTACGEKEEASSDDKEDKVELTLDKDATPEPTEAPTPEPTEVPTPEPTEAPTPTPEPTATPSPEPTQVPVAEHTYKVELVEVGDQKVMAIKLYRDFTGAGLAEAKDAIDNAPCVVMETTNEEAANTCIEAFEGIGGVVKVYVDGEEVVDEEESKPTDDSEVTSGDDAFEQLQFSIYLEDVGAEKVKVIKIIRDELGYGLKEAKDLVDAAPVIIYVIDDLIFANDVCDKLAEVGSMATVETFENPVVGENPKAESGEDVNTEVEEETEVEDTEDTGEEPEETTEEIPDEDTEVGKTESSEGKEDKFGYFKWTAYQVYMESAGENAEAVLTAYENYFGVSGTPIASYDILSLNNLVVWEIYSKELANELNIALQNAGATSSVREVNDAYVIPDEIIPMDEREEATFIPRDFKLDPKLNNMFVGQMVYGSLAIGDKVYAVLEDGTEVELVIRRTYRLDERLHSIEAGDWSALMFESNIPGDQACQTIKVVKRTEE